MGNLDFFISNKKLLESMNRAVVRVEGPEVASVNFAFRKNIWKFNNQRQNVQNPLRSVGTLERKKMAFFSNSTISVWQFSIYYIFRFPLSCGFFFTDHKLASLCLTLRNSNLY